MEESLALGVNLVERGLLEDNNLQETNAWHAGFMVGLRFQVLR